MSDDIKSTSLEFLPNKMADDKDESEVLEFVRAQQRESSRFDRDFKGDCIDDFFYLQSILPSGWDQRFFTQTFQPETAITARDTVEAVMSSLFGGDTFFDLWGDDGQNEVSIEKMREKMKAELLREQFKVQAYLWGQEMVNYGNGVMCTFAEPHWETTTKTEPIIDPNFGIQIGQREVKERTVQVRSRLRVVSRFDLFPYPGHFNDVQTMPFFLVREFMPLSAFKTRAKWERWKNADKVDGWLFSGRSSKDTDDYETENLYTRLEATGWGVNGTDFGMGQIKWVELWHYYEAPPGGVGCRAYAVVADGKHLLCCRANKYQHAMKPIADMMMDNIDPMLWQATGIPRRIRPYQDQVNMREAMYSDLMEFYRNPHRIAGPGLGIKPLTRLMPRPGAVTQASGDMNQLKVLEMPPPPPGLLQLADRAHIGIQRASKQTDLGRGIVGNNTGLGEGDKTASGMAQLLNAGAKAATFQTKFQEERGIVPFLQQFGSNIQQYMPAEGEMLNLRQRNDTLRKAGVESNGRVMIRPEDIKGQFTFRAVGSTKAMEDPQRGGAMMQFWSTIFSDPELRSRYSKPRVAASVHEMTFKRPMSEFEKTDAEQQQDQGMIKPLPPQSLVKYEKAPASVQRQIEQREGFQPATEGGTSPQELQAAKNQAKLNETDAKQIGKSLGAVAESHLKRQPTPPAIRPPARYGRKPAGVPA